MTRPGDASRKLLVAIGLSIAIGSFTAVAWLGFALESGWVARVAITFVAAVVTTGSALILRAAWRYSITLPLPAGTANSWLVRQPGWMLALIWFGVIEAPWLAMGTWAKITHHPAMPTALLASCLAGGLIGSACMSLMLRVNWRIRAQVDGGPS